MNAPPRPPAVVDLIALAVTLSLSNLACFQEVDSSAASATNATNPMAATTHHTVDLMTPAIQLAAGDDTQTTDDACAATTFHATAILRASCAACHGGGPGQNLGQPPFNFVLDVPKLLTAVSATVKDPTTMQPVRFLVPGDPDHSRLYVRMFRREMPPGDIVGLPPTPNRPTVSDVSVVRQWIAQCLGANEDVKGARPPNASDAGVGGGGAPGRPDASGGQMIVDARAAETPAGAASPSDGGVAGDGGPRDAGPPPRRLDGGGRRE